MSTKMQRSSCQVFYASVKKKNRLRFPSFTTLYKNNNTINNSNNDRRFMAAHTLQPIHTPHRPGCQKMCGKWNGPLQVIRELHRSISNSEKYIQVMMDAARWYPSIVCFVLFLKRQHTPFDLTQGKSFLSQRPKCTSCATVLCHPYGWIHALNRLHIPTPLHSAQSLTLH